MTSTQPAYEDWLAHPGQVLLLGFARSGAAAATLLSQHGFAVTVNERGERPATDVTVERLEASGVHFVFGGHPLALLDEPWQFIVKNPGIPYDMPLVAEAVARGIPIYTEVEIASWFTDAPIYAITGSNGKTTTTTLVGEMLRAAKQAPVVAGNIGTVVSGLVDTLQPTQPLVLEVSSFQIMGTATFHPRIAALLNFFPAHLDYHGTYEDYQRAKWQLFANQTEADVAVLNRDQPLVRAGAATLRANVHWFSLETADFEQGAALVNDHVVLIRDGVERPLLAVADVALKGRHNLANLLAAAAIAQAAGAPDAALRTVAMTFQGVEHRLEFVREHAGVRYYNDSKATNPAACRQALHAFPGPLVWIAGGLDRGISFDELVPDLTGRVKAAILLGETKEKLAAACAAAGIAVIKQVATLDDAVAQAHRCAGQGDVVLLSPACASWDMFKSFEVRGSMFKEAVHRL